MPSPLSVTEVTVQPVEPLTFACRDAHTASVKVLSRNKSAAVVPDVTVRLVVKLPLKSVGTEAVVEPPFEVVPPVPTLVTLLTFHMLLLREVSKPVVKLEPVPAVTVDWAAFAASLDGNVST